MYNLIAGVLAGIVLGTLSVRASGTVARSTSKRDCGRNSSRPRGSSIRSRRRSIYMRPRVVACRRSATMALRSPGSSKTAF